jgi:predicted nucleic acid-binding protein
VNRFVIDASALIKLVIPETDSEAMHALASSFRTGQTRLLAPDFILVECANVLWKYALQTQTPESEVLEPSVCSCVWA